MTEGAADAAANFTGHVTLTAITGSRRYAPIATTTRQSPSVLQAILTTHRRGGTVQKLEVTRMNKLDGKLPYVTTQGAFTCSNMRPPDVGGMAEVITADAVEGVYTESWAYNKLVELGLEKAE